MSSLSYSTLKEAYGLKKNRVQESTNYMGADNKDNKNLNQGDIKENLIDYANHDDCYYEKYNINMKSCNKDVEVENKNKVKLCDKFTDYSNIDDYNKVNNENNCTPLQAPTYNYPISEESKKKFKEAIDATFMKQQQPTYNEYNKRTDITKIKPYDDDELDQYLSFENFKEAITYKPPENLNNIPPSTNNMPSSTNNMQNTTSYPIYRETDKNINKEEIDPNRFHNKTGELTSLEKSFLLSQMNEENNKKLEESEKKNRMYNNYINIGLFIFIGIAIILLCDQISEISINIGMRKTAKILEPILIKLQELNNKERNNI
jgi:hypothetical protein